jgi:hypothetical protein
MNSLDHTHRHYFAKLVVQYLAYIPEEAEKVGTFKDNTTAQMKVSQVSHGAIEVIIPYLDYPNLEVQELALNGISSWVSNSTVPMDLLIPLLELVLKKMITFDLLEVISDMLATLFSDKRLASMETVVPELFLPVFVGEVYQSGLKEAIEGTFD